jgi:hypothetical protein
MLRSTESDGDPPIVERGVGSKPHDLHRGVFGLLAAVIVWSSKANAPADVASSPTGVLTLVFLG